MNKKQKIILLVGLVVIIALLFLVLKDQSVIEEQNSATMPPTEELATGAPDGNGGERSTAEAQDILPATGMIAEMFDQVYQLSVYGYCNMSTDPDEAVVGSVVMGEQILTLVNCLDAGSYINRIMAWQSGPEGPVKVVLFDQFDPETGEVYGSDVFVEDGEFNNDGQILTRQYFSSDGSCGVRETYNLDMVEMITTDSPQPATLVSVHAKTQCDGSAEIWPLVYRR